MARIGVLEDCDEVRDLITTILTERGHQVMEWCSVADARGGLAAFEPELLMLDVELPDGCGLDLAGTRDGRGRVIPTIVLSSLESEGDIVRGFVAGAADYMTKPFTPHELLARVSVHLARSGSTEDNSSSQGLNLPERGGLVFGRYVVERLLGRGGYGAVYLARDSSRGGEHVALKVLAPLIGEQTDSRMRFIRETYAVSRLDHPRVAAVRDVGAFQGRLYYAMDFVDGLSLQQWVAEHGTVNEVEALALLRPLLEGMVALERAGIVHRDIKPENVVLRAGRLDDPVLVDFGLRKVPFDHGVTNNDFIMGTPAYLPPELILGAVAGYASDLFQVGLTIRFALTGDIPFPALQGLELLTTIARGPLPSLGAQVSPGFGALLSRLLAQAPAGRPSAEAALAWALELQEAETTERMRTPLALAAAKARQADVSTVVGPAGTQVGTSAVDGAAPLVDGAQSGWQKRAEC